MLKKFLKPLIIVAVQVILLLILMAFITPLLLKNTESVNQFNHVFQHYKWFFLIAHGVCYAALYCLWPFLIQLIIRKQSIPPTEQQLKQAMNARLYLLALFILFELLHLLG
jgi:uncharacterized membrane protein YbhN (UPF0104 family)